MSNGHYQFHYGLQDSQSYGDSRHLPSPTPSFDHAPIQAPQLRDRAPSWTSVTSTYTGYDGEDAVTYPTPDALACKEWILQQELKRQGEAMLAARGYNMGAAETPPQSREMTPSDGSASTYDGSDDDEDTETEGGDFDDGASSISRIRYRTPSVEPTYYYARSATAPPAPPTPTRGPIPGTSDSVSAASTSLSESTEGRPRRANKPSLRRREHDEYMSRTSPKKKQYGSYSLSAGGTSRRF
ncbi:unnamed protein product [Cyclocybe aegerita]|uniref:Uncharacterized protein n=1 Tax=Cyclocybe aegerita TaxID=1973307 RepID=A0A8S0VSP7_CYCAE|nr:unnamed protein product [Cyclocybe aegerita]